MDDRIQIVYGGKMDNAFSLPRKTNVYVNELIMHTFTFEYMQYTIS